MGQEDILVSVIIATYGRPDFLGRCLLSVASQSYGNLEIIVVDDNPPESDGRSATESLMMQWGDDTRVSYIKHRENLGGAVARNTGLSRSTGQFVTFLDDDDTYEIDKVKKQLEHMLRESLDLSLCDMRYSRDGRLIESKQCHAQGKTIDEFLRRGVAYTPMIMARRSLLESVGGFYDTPRFQDHILMLRMLAVKPHAGILSEPLFTHYEHSSDQITFSPAYRLGFTNKHKFERGALYLVGPRTRRGVVARQYLEMARIEAFSGKITKSFCLIVKALYFANSRELVTLALRTSYRSIFTPKRPL